MTGRFVVVEGGEGVGKSTQVALLARRLRAHDYDVRVTREPGSTDLGTQIRALLLEHDAPIDARTELLLLLADRAQHVAEVIRPALAAGAIVVSDRFSPSSLAYQGVARSLGVDDVERLSAWAAAGVEPDLVVVLELPDDVAETRVARTRDRVERAGDEFHRTVRRAYRELAGARGWIVVDAQGTPAAVADRVWEVVKPILP